MGSKYLRPAGKVRYLYLLFIPGWLCLGVSIYYGEMVVRRFIAAAFAEKSELLRDIAKLMNGEFAQQRLYLQLALLAVGCWLISPLVRWVFSQVEPAQEADQ